MNYGETPTCEQIDDLIAWLNTSVVSSPLAISTLPLKFNPSNAYKDKACGVLAIPITKLNNHYLLFYRPELIHAISWAGNPADSLRFDNKSYCPLSLFIKQN
jgi:light-regulated signal transduction histidine kinase (bacteriophytochrome)